LAQNCDDIWDAALPFDAHICQAAAPVKGQKGACGVGDVVACCLLLVVLAVVVLQAGCTVRCHKRAETHQICQELQRRCMEQIDMSCDQIRHHYCHEA